MIRIKRSKFIALLVGVIIATLLTASLAFVIACKAVNLSLVQADQYKQAKKIVKQYGKLSALQQMVNENTLWKVDNEEEMTAVYKGLVDSLDDEYSAYFTEEEAKAWDNMVNGTFYGIGVLFSQNKDGEFVISEVMKDSPAQEAGLKAKDKILKVDGKKYTTNEEMVGAIRGEQGTKVKLTIGRGDETLKISVIRGEVTERTVAGAMLKGDLAYIRISSFSQTTADEFSKEMTRLEKKKPKGLVIDLRDNSGGYAAQGMEIADQLLPECTITYLQDKKGKKTYYNSKEGATDLKYVLLVNENTASTSEILASAVKDNEGGKLVGTTTFGKGNVQQEYHFKDGSALKLTTHQYFSPKGKEINKVGVKPDVKVELPEDAKTDVQLEKAMEILQ